MARSLANNIHFGQIQAIHSRVFQHPLERALNRRARNALGYKCPKAEEDKSSSEHSSAEGRIHVSLKPHALSWGCSESET